MSKLSSKISAVFDFPIREGRWEWPETLNQEGEPTRKNMAEVIMILCQAVEDLQMQSGRDQKMIDEENKTLDQRQKEVEDYDRRVREFEKALVEWENRIKEAQKKLKFDNEGLEKKREELRKKEAELAAK